ATRGAWGTRVYTWIQAPGRAPLPWLFFTFEVQADGSFLPSPEGKWTGLAGPLSAQVEAGLRAAPDPEAPLDASKKALHGPLLALAFGHCKNVTLTEHAPPPKLAAAQMKRRGWPMVTYKTLEIQPMLGVLRHEGGMARGASAQRALHITRGHFKHYQEGHGLFGKHAGLFWWDMHVRGSLRHGVVEKDYAVRAPEPPP